VRDDVAVSEQRGCEADGRSGQQESSSTAASSLLFFACATQQQHQRRFKNFNSVHEWRTVWIPGLVERRLFALAVAQRPSVALTVEARVVLLEVVSVPGGVGNDAGSSSCPAVHPRGCVCCVVGFLTADQLFSTDRVTSQRSSLPSLVRWRVAGWTTVERLYLTRYMERQRHAPALPLLRCLLDAAAPAVEIEGYQRRAHGDDDVFLLAPQPYLIGGYPSTHYYGLPMLHLPIRQLTGGRAHDLLLRNGARVYQRNCRPQRTRESTLGLPPVSATLCEACAGPRSFCVVALSTVSFKMVLSVVFPLYHADAAHSKAGLSLTPAERVTALCLLFASMAKEGGDPNRHHPGKTAAGGITHTPLSFMEDVLFYEAAALSPFGLATAAPSEVGATVVVPVRCPLVTELGLYARFAALT
jgi:hypothetical protein